MSPRPADSSSGPPSLGDLTEQLRKAGIDTSILEQNLKLASAAVELASQQPVQSPPALTSAAIAAATRGCFLPSDLATSSDPQALPAEDIESLLAHSDVITRGSQRAWQLRRDARRDI